jgi:hypothetical protein
MKSTDRGAVKTELDKLTAQFFRAVSFEEGATPPYDDLHSLFIEAGLLIKNSGTTPEISTVSQFIEPRLASVRAGELTRFNEMELSETTRIFGNVVTDSTLVCEVRHYEGHSLRSARHDLHPIHPDAFRLENQRDGLGRRTAWSIDSGARRAHLRARRELTVVHAPVNCGVLRR